MMDLRPIILIIGILLSALAVGMCVPAVVDGVAGNPDWQVFAVSAGLTLFIGVTMALTSRAGVSRLTIRQAFLMTTLIWLVLTLFAALPFAFSELDLSYTDAFFEAMSGITTTGSTVITGLDSAPPGILLWRGILQWMGGLGIIVLAVGVLPMLRVGGMQLFRIEAFESGEKVLPRAAHISIGITAVFVALTALWAGGLWLAGMSGLEAVVHAMTTIATGGYSTSDGSLGHFDSPLIDAIVTAGMVVGGIPFLLYLKALRGDTSSLFRDNQVHWYLTILAGAVLAVAGWLWAGGDMMPLEALRYAAFNVTSIMTGTGYSTADYTGWGTFPVGLLFLLMFVGGCAGSTTCSIKVFRFQVLYAAARAQIHNLLQPHGVFVPYFNRRPISEEVITSVLSFFFVFGAAFVLLALGLSLLGLDFVTAFSGAATAISNVGPAMGTIIGPSGTFQSLPDAAKWLLSAGMLVGRLEVFTVIVLFSRSFWRD